MRIRIHRQTYTWDVVVTPPLRPDLHLEFERELPLAEVVTMAVKAAKAYTKD